ncbi:hypothetical protein NADFUDRAFT_80000 [Nadsonia fulvescens var. elongata DSM 6958]|uniref:Uncharacterized protein n=1 Tax=Nadsonia fulvescens var. elongata DSM 6958 TaxID=857566 RepID=A0A1E3PEL3_9ASCO|nr:hypothetical protein NADFUDRAFT_80000 [Nadsonia fulvescens var. elongata DSM 6958]
MSSKIIQVPPFTSTTLTSEGDEFVETLFDEDGERKIDSDGNLLDGRSYKMKTFNLPDRGTKLFCMATECAKELGFRDSYLLFTKNKSLYKMIANQTEKEAMIAAGLLPYAFRSRTIGLITARSIFRTFGARGVLHGKHVRDDYWVKLAIEQGFTEETGERKSHHSHHNSNHNNSANNSFLNNASSMGGAGGGHGQHHYSGYGGSRRSQYTGGDKIDDDLLVSMGNGVGISGFTASGVAMGSLLSGLNGKYSQRFLSSLVGAQALNGALAGTGGTMGPVSSSSLFLGDDLVDTNDEPNSEPANKGILSGSLYERKLAFNYSQEFPNTGLFIPGSSIGGSIDFQVSGMPTSTAKMASAQHKYINALVNNKQATVNSHFTTPEVEASHSAVEFNKYLATRRNSRNRLWKRYWLSRNLPASKESKGILEQDPPAPQLLPLVQTQPPPSQQQTRNADTVAAGSSVQDDYNKLVSQVDDDKLQQLQQNQLNQLRLHQLQLQQRQQQEQQQRQQQQSQLQQQLQQQQFQQQHLQQLQLQQQQLQQQHQNHTNNTNTNKGINKSKYNINYNNSFNNNINIRNITNSSNSSYRCSSSYNNCSRDSNSHFNLSQKIRKIH